MQGQGSPDFNIAAIRNFSRHDMRHYATPVVAIKLFQTNRIVPNPRLEILNSLSSIIRFKTNPLIPSPAEYCT